MKIWIIFLFSFQTGKLDKNYEKILFSREKLIKQLTSEMQTVEIWDSQITLQICLPLWWKLVIWQNGCLQSSECLTNQLNTGRWSYDDN